MYTMKDNEKDEPDMVTATKCSVGFSDLATAISGVAAAYAETRIVVKDGYIFLECPRAMVPHYRGVVSGYIKGRGVSEEC